MDVGEVKAAYEKISGELSEVIVGKKDIIQNIFIALLADGHALLEGVPGIAKTYIAKNFSTTLGCKFRRIQFTPDLLPMDILGSNVFNQKSGRFEFREGPVFANIILADEINRAPPKTQSALLECMQERQVTIEGKTYILPAPFLVLATQNPIELEGTYPLPEAQIDRFLMRILIGYPADKGEEIEILRKKDVAQPLEVLTITSPHEITKLQKTIRKVTVEESVKDYISELIIQTRKNDAVLLGGSPRASIALQQAAKVLAAINDRDFVVPDDIKVLLVPVLNHRLILKPEVELGGKTVLNVIDEIATSVKVPR